MLPGLYISANGMAARIAQQEITANNVANLNTPGFKREAATFRELYSSLTGSTLPILGLEAKTDFRQGSLQRTGDPLNFALEDRGFFTVETPQGMRYTRNGDFTLNEKGVLITQEGYPVWGESGPIVIDGDEVAVNSQGEVMVDGKLVDPLLISDFELPYTLRKEGEGLFAPLDGRKAKPRENPRILQGYLEASNVAPAKEMMELITILRLYEANQKAILLQDNTLNKTVNDLGRIR